MFSFKAVLLTFAIFVLLCPDGCHGFGAGNIASIARIEGHNWRHGDIEDMLKNVACLKGYKWTSMMIKHVYFGNWLRDYSQAVDVGTLKGVQAGTIRILVWILSFMSFGYATQEFEVTEERLGVYRPEEHIDNPKDYADNIDARQYDPRLRGPVQQAELEVDMRTGMKNYIANEDGGWATSLGFVKHSFARSAHYGRLFTSGSHGSRGKDSDLYEALRCLGQGLHCLEDFGAHTNYTELSLRELGFHNVFPHTGVATGIELRGKRTFPLVTGTFGGVDFLHSVLGEATDHVTQSEVSEVDEMNKALGAAAAGGNTRGGSDSLQQANTLIGLLSSIPGTSDLCKEAQSLQQASQAQAMANARALGDPDEPAELSSEPFYGGAPVPSLATSQAQAKFNAPGQAGPQAGGGLASSIQNVDIEGTVKKIYPILAFRDNVVRTISGIVSKIPGLEALVDKISETVTLFIMSLLAPYIQPIIVLASKQLKVGSSGVIESSAKQQFAPWEDPHCTNPTHSLLSKDHFSNILNEPAGLVASEILQYVAPRIIYTWEHPNIPLDQVFADISRVFHHPALRDMNCEVHRKMFQVVENWAHKQPGKGRDLDTMLSSEAVKAGKNHTGGAGNPHIHDTSLGGSHGPPPIPGVPQKYQNQMQSLVGGGSHSKVAGSPFEMMGRKREMGELAYGDYGSYVEGQSSYAQAPPFAAAHVAGDSTSMPTAYQQGYDVPYTASHQHQSHMGREEAPVDFSQMEPGYYGNFGGGAGGGAEPPYGGGYGRETDSTSHGYGERQGQGHGAENWLSADDRPSQQPSPGFGYDRVDVGHGHYGDEHPHWHGDSGGYGGDYGRDYEGSHGGGYGRDGDLAYGQDYGRDYNEGQGGGYGGGHEDRYRY